MEDGRVVTKELFPPEAAAIAERLRRVRKGEILAEERRLADGGVEVTEARLRSLGALVDPRGFPPVPEGIRPEVLRDAVLLVARDESRAASGDRDRFIAQSVKAMDEIVRNVNTLVERLREWYGLHFPEASRAVPDQATFARQVSEAASRDELAKRIPGLHPVESIGIEFSAEQLEAVQGFAAGISHLYSELVRLGALVEKETKQVAPTLAGTVGSLIAARLIAQAGGLERLANLPASTIQTLGAENALFLHLREGKKPPKHGILFQHALVNTAPWKERGRISRRLAGQSAIAARMDFFSPGGGDRSKELLTAIEKAVDRVRKKGARRPRPQRGVPAR